MPMQDDDDTTGDVISFNGEATATETDDTPGNTREDRGDDPGAEPAEVAKAKPVEKAVVDKAPDEAHEPEHKAEKPQHIPKARFDEVNNQKKELAEQLAEARSLLESMRQQPRQADPAPDPAPVFDEAGKEREYLDALMEGESDKAAEIRMEINRNLREQATADAEARQATREAQAEGRQNEAKVEVVRAQALVDYPFLGEPEGDEVVELINAAFNRRIAGGMEHGKALAEAVATVAPKFAPGVTVAPGEGSQTAARVDTRPRDALARGAADSNRQPASIQDGSGNRASAARVDVTDMSEEQFENLSKADKKRLRGDQ